MNAIDYILDHLGRDATPEMVQAEYAGKSYDAIVSDLNELYPQDDNAALAIMIRDYVAPSGASLGRISTDRKAAAARENGKRGGRPRKTQAPA